MKPGDLIRFSKPHREKPGLDYTDDWVGLVVKKVVDSEGALAELHVLWQHGEVSDYPSSWWNRLSYEPFELVSEGG